MLALLGSVFVASVLGSLHCVGMCGPIAALASAPTDRVRLPVLEPRRRGVLSAFAYGGGRLLGYVALGMAAGAAGMAFDLSGTDSGSGKLASTVAGSAMIVLGGLGLARAVVRSRGSGRATKLLGAVVRRLPTRARPLWLGLATPMLPCGWLHAFTLMAAGTASVWSGAAVMVSFWLGTVPAMTLLGVGVHHLSFRWRARLPLLMSLMVLAVGVHMLATRGLGAPSPAPAQHAHDRGAPCH